MSSRADDRTTRAENPGDRAKAHAAAALAILLARHAGCLELMSLADRDRAERLALDAGIELAPPRITKPAPTSDHGGN